jgi:hypothetical protein
MFAKRNYAHRLNEDGTFYSICLRCFRTVASEYSEARLAEGRGNISAWLRSLKPCMVIRENGTG